MSRILHFTKIHILIPKVSKKAPVPFVSLAYEKKIGVSYIPHTLNAAFKYYLQ